MDRNAIGDIVRLRFALWTTALTAALEGAKAGTRSQLTPEPISGLPFWLLVTGKLHPSKEEQPLTARLGQSSRETEPFGLRFAIESDPTFRLSVPPYLVGGSSTLFYLAY
jgi:hypothetical protein